MLISPFTFTFLLHDGNHESGTPLVNLILFFFFDLRITNAKHKKKKNKKEKKERRTLYEKVNFKGAS